MAEGYKGLSDGAGKGEGFKGLVDQTVKNLTPPPRRTC